MSDEMPSNARFRHEATLSSDGNTVQLMADYMSSGYDPILFNSPTRGLQSAFTMDIEDVLRLDVHNFQLPQFESNDRVNQILPTSHHRQAEMMIPDSQSCMPSSTASSSAGGGYTDHIKMEVMPLNNSMSSTTSSSTAVPSSIPYTGEYGFEIAFEQQNKETKSINWTYSELLNKLYVRMGSTCPIRFRTTRRPPNGCVIRATPVYMKPEHVQEVVTRCPNHTSTKELNENHPAPKHLVRCEHKLAKYLEDRMTGRQSVIVPHEQPQAGAEWVTNLYQFMCFSSCVGGLSRRPIQLIFTLEHGTRVCGRQSLEVRICACPGRDRRTDEESSQSAPRPVAGQKSNGKARTDGGAGAGVGRAAAVPRKMQKMDDDDELYTLTVHGRENYELLSRVNEALELTSRIPEYEREMYLKQCPDSQISNDELLNCSDLDASDLPDSKSPKKTNVGMTFANGFGNYKPISKPPYKAPTNLY